MKKTKETGGFRLSRSVNESYILNIGDELTIDGFEIKVKRITKVEIKDGKLEVIGIYEDL